MTESFHLLWFCEQTGSRGHQSSDERGLTHPGFSADTQKGKEMGEKQIHNTSRTRKERPVLGVWRMSGAKAWMNVSAYPTVQSTVIIVLFSHHV